MAGKECEDEADVHMREPEEEHTDQESIDTESEPEGELDEEDLELIRENLERTKSEKSTSTGRNKRIIEDSDEEEEEPVKDKKSLEDMFSDEDRDSSEEEGLDDFIEDVEGKDEEKYKPSQKASKRPTLTFLWSGNKHVSKEAWNDLMDIFGDGSEYADLVWEQCEDGDEEGPSEDQVDATDSVKQSAVQFEIVTFPDHSMHLSEEAVWMQREFRRQFGIDTDNMVIEECLELMVNERLSVPFIAAFRRDQCHPLKVFHLWSIFDWNQTWISAKKAQLRTACASLDNAEMITEWVKRLPRDSEAGVGLPPGQFAANVKAWAPLYPPVPIQSEIDELVVIRSLLLSEAIDPLVKRIEAGLTASTSITEAGKRLGMRHPLAHLLNIQDKPVQSFAPDQFALLHFSVQRNYCTTQLQFKDKDQILDQVRQLYSADAQGDHIVKELLDGLVERVIKRQTFKLPRDSAVFIAQACGFELQAALAPSVSPPVTVICQGIDKNIGIVRMEGRQVLECNKFGKPNDDSEWNELIESIDIGDRILVSGNAVDCLHLYNRLQKAGIKGEFVSDDVARIQPRHLVESCPAIQGQSPIIKYCVTVGLRHSCPVDVFGVLDEQELLKLHLQPHRHYIDSDLLLVYLRRAISNAVNRYGITSEQTWLFKYLASTNGFMLSDDDDDDGLGQFMIPREDRGIVGKMLTDAMEGEPLPLAETIKLAQEQPHRLLQLDLVDYDKHLGGGRLMMLEEYRRRIIHHDTNNRKQLSKESIFWMVSGERPDRLQPGRLVRVRLPSQSTFCSSVIANLEGSELPVKCMLDSRWRPGIQDAVVLCINLNDFDINNHNSIANVVRVSMHRDDVAEPKVPLHADAYYRRPVISDPKPTADSKKEGRTVQVPPAVLHHPVFRPNMSRAQAEAFLARAVAGEAVVWVEKNHLIASWRCCTNIPSLISHLPLTFDSKHYILTINNHSCKYEDLDEVIARGIEPNARLLDDILACPKALSISASTDKEASVQVEQLLQSQARQTPGRIAYGLWLSRDTPGTALLSIAPRHHEHIQVEDGVYLFRRHTFSTLAALIDHLKRP